MIKINLLPMDLRESETKPSRYPVRKIVTGTAAALLAIFLYQVIMYTYSRSVVRHLGIETEKLAQPAAEAERVDYAVNKELLPQKRFFHQFVIAHVWISEALNNFSDLLPHGMWFSRMKLAREQGYVRVDISGYTRITSSEIALAQIQEYVNAVKSKMEDSYGKAEGEGGKAGYKVKAILTTNREKLGSTEVMQFNASFTNS